MTDCPPRFRERLALVIRSLRRLALATLFLGLGTFLLTVSREQPEPEQAPPSPVLEDYLPTARSLMAEGRTGEVVAIGDYVRGQSDLPHAADIVAIRDSAVADAASWRHRGWSFAKGYVTGDISSAPALIGTVAADFTVYGNVRDLGKQGYGWYKGESVDRLIVALSAVGLAADIATYFPATSEVGVPTEGGFSLLKALKRVGAMSPRLATRLLTLARESKTPAKAMELGRCAAETLRLTRRLPAGTVGRVMKSAETVDDVAILARWAEKAPSELVVASHVLGAESREGLRFLQAGDAAVDGGKLAHALRFGRRGFTATAKTVSTASRVGRFVYLGHAKAVAQRLLPSRWLNFLGAMSIATGSLFLLSAINGIGRATKRKTRDPDDTAPTNTNLPDVGPDHSASA